MRKFLISVNGTSYEVEVEEMDSKAVAAASSKSVQKAEAPKAEAPKAEAPKAAAGETKVTAPMPGTIKKVMVKKGDSIKSGDVLFILEAMKLENEIMAPCAGTVTFVGASESGMVNPGDVLCIIA